MRNLSKYLSLTALTGLISVGAAMDAQATLDDTQLLDLHGITDVRVSGANTRLSVTADASRPAGITVLDQGGKNCKMTATATREGNALSIQFDLRQSGLGFGFINKCDPNVSVNLGAGTNLDIALDKMVAQINGQYSNLNVQTKEAVVNFDGQASNVNLEGDKVVATVILNNAAATDLVRVHGQKLVIDLGFAATAQLAYSINSGVTLFSRGIAESANAPTRIDISAEVLKGSTYVDSSAL